MATKRGRGTTWTYVAQSPIHGKGLFAARDIPKDVCIGEATGPHTTKDGIHTIWVDNGDGTETGTRVTNDLRYVNHAKRPNAAFFGTELWTLRAIPKDEEITHYYGDAWEELD